MHRWIFSRLRWSLRQTICRIMVLGLLWGLNSMAQAATVTHADVRRLQILVALDEQETSRLFPGDTVKLHHIHAKIAGTITKKSTNVVAIKIDHEADWRFRPGTKLKVKKYGNSTVAADQFRAEEIRNSSALAPALKGGVISDGVVGLGGEVYYHINRHFELGLSFVSGTQGREERELKDLRFQPERRELSQGSRADSLTTKASIFTVGVRYFVNDWLFVQGGLGSRELESHYRINDQTNGATAQHRIKFISYAAQAGIGGAWMFGNNMRLGVEALSMVVPLETQGFRKRTQSVDLSEAAFRYEYEVEQALSVEATKSGYQLGVISVGYLL